MKGAHQPARSAKKKRVAKASGLTSEIVAKIGRQINDRWPNLGRQLASLFRASHEKIDDLYSSVAQAVSEQKEAFDDRRAARKAQDRAEIRTVPQAVSAHPGPRARATNGSGVSPSPKRTSS